METVSSYLKFQCSLLTIERKNKEKITTAAIFATKNVRTLCDCNTQLCTSNEPPYMCRHAHIRFFESGHLSPYFAPRRLGCHVLFPKSLNNLAPRVFSPPPFFAQESRQSNHVSSSHLFFAPRPQQQRGIASSGVKNGFTHGLF